jgi:hypothetical protein
VHGYKGGTSSSGSGNVNVNVSTTAINNVTIVNNGTSSSSAVDLTPVLTLLNQVIAPTGQK